MGFSAEQKIRQLGIPIGSVHSPWLVVTMLRHGSLSNSFDDIITFFFNNNNLKIL